MMATTAEKEHALSLAQMITAIIAALGVIVAAVSALKALAEYRKQGITKRSEIFLQMRSRLREDESFKRICEHDDERLREESLVEKDRFIGFFEELALLRNSGFINDHVTLYMFGYFAVRCFESKNLWNTSEKDSHLNRDHPLWALFMDFAEQMQGAERTFRYERRHFHL
jgi:predicted ATPase